MPSAELSSDAYDDSWQDMISDSAYDSSSLRSESLSPELQTNIVEGFANENYNNEGAESLFVNDSAATIYANSSEDNGVKRRGRPPKLEIEEMISQNVQEQLVNPICRDDPAEKLRCCFCRRPFGRMKAKKIHEATHSGTKKYKCTFPNCGRKFTQSGHLRTHEWIHTGCKPFHCRAPDCTTQERHTNRKCSKHPDLKLVRKCVDLHTLENLVKIQRDPAKKAWFEMYLAKERESQRKKENTEPKRKKTRQTQKRASVIVSPNTKRIPLMQDAEQSAPVEVVECDTTDISNQNLQETDFKNQMAVNNSFTTDPINSSNEIEAANTLLFLRRSGNK